MTDSTKINDCAGVKQFEVFFDGDCPLCRREIDWLRKKDKRGNILFSDIAVADFDCTEVGKTNKELMDFIHGRFLAGKRAGELTQGVEVFRNIYAQLGWKWVVGTTRIPGISHLLDGAYWVFAKNRLWITGRREKCTDAVCSTAESANGVAK